MAFDNAFEALTEAHDDSRWAFGTGFEDPLSGVDTTVPSEIDGAALAAYCLMLGDDALIFSHRLQQWCTNAPELEDEVAIANIGLDLLGQARLLLARAGKVTGRTEDSYAFFREEREFRNVRLAELERGDFGQLIAVLLVFATWRLSLFSRLTESADPVLAAIAAKGVKELTYHRDYAAQWAVRLGDGTEYSHERMQAGLDGIWPYVEELFTPHAIELEVGVDPSTVRPEFDDVLARVLSAATLVRPEIPGRAGVSGRTGRDGVHTEAMGYLLAELQSVARAHPEATW
ncbi:ring-1,2-phenylacetyl-CoA epoxidase subunit PaaC [Amycolatopsis bartoniae]|uniref:Phenylacetate-CoA oxygenase subunit PaaI n=1 Tax=Amycolatopsis bartoniae TaxID=941986 RepID=A0A8H9IZW3_9PSEU|nr:1,2-phenylacetyl-CoA epoxidase subunit PaaC [Amycolatopsis bartoniae]MBB2938927.1 ring-1,2-phenylacetyl-CoA epoxidase subunit PaaC [Amycolatopsis bartoniae]TVT11260.1 phenylacetate-CoA oxygenase subunit PaaC [Amycolatopsis bartoniae]GHF66115.1 phenylacetate-CoA oxygenase subunit PaaI [Amycolatopsis bartoniae]